MYSKIKELKDVKIVIEELQKDISVDMEHKEGITNEKGQAQIDILEELKNMIKEV